MTKQPNNLLTKRVNTAATAVMKRNQNISYPELFIELGILSRKDYAAWESGQVPFLEKVIQCNLTKLARIITAVRRLARNGNLDRKIAPKPKRSKRYSKTGNDFIEDEYRAVYSVRTKAKATALADKVDLSSPEN